MCQCHPRSWATCLRCVGETLEPREEKVLFPVENLKIHIIIMFTTGEKENRNFNFSILFELMISNDRYCCREIIFKIISYK